ncbi:hypothetical protein [Sedimentibacter sp.]|uniref:hypothetical protein n=1 Tax=Sedimentibacter sp. TaxID=1960295 RepID=UPI0028A8BE0B|nr:hypothetical protein [Sedimentibacter sp.]
MKKIFYYTPFFFYLSIVILCWSIGLVINIDGYAILIIFLISGILLSRNKILGGITGIGGSFYIFYLGLSNWKLQSIDFIVSVSIFVFYLGCMIYLLRRKHS